MINRYPMVRPPRLPGGGSRDGRLRSQPLHPQLQPLEHEHDEPCPQAQSRIAVASLPSPFKETSGGYEL
jgi:hypothetical protein